MNVRKFAYSVATVSIFSASIANGSPANAAPVATILYSFTGESDCGEPGGTVIADRTGTLYGLTGGGFRGCNGGTLGAGVLFTLTPNGHGYTFGIAYNFTGQKGDDVPQAPLTMDASGALYAVGNGGGLGCDRLVKLTRSHGTFVESVSYPFSCTFGYQHQPGLVVDSSGSIYGTSFNGGPSGAGVAYKLTPSGSTYTETALHSFSGGASDGGYPNGFLQVDRNGVVYGTNTQGGSAGRGNVFTIAPSGAYTVLHDFGRKGDGAIPLGGVILDKFGSVYGETEDGGVKCPRQEGCGTVFRLSPNGNTYVETILHSFSNFAALGYSAAGGGLTPGADATIHGIFGGPNLEDWGVFTLRRDRERYSETSYRLGKTFLFINGPLLAGDSGAYFGTTFFGGAHGVGCVFAVTF